MKHTFHCMTLGSNLDAALTTTLENILWIARDNLSADQRAIATKLAGEHGVLTVERPKGISATHVAEWLMDVGSLPEHLITKEMRKAKDSMSDPHGQLVAIEAAYTEATEYIRSHGIYTSYRRPQVFHLMGTAFVRPTAAQADGRGAARRNSKRKTKTAA